MLPVLECPGWQVETVIIDLGDGLREWIEIRHGDEPTYCASAAQRDLVLRGHGVAISQFVEVDTVFDGCE